MASRFSSPWPDPNSPVLSKIDFGVPLVELFKWLDVRDTLLGENGRTRYIASALALAHDCKHPDAVWLTSIFEGKDISTEKDVREVFLSLEHDARALGFAWYLTDDRKRDLTLLRRAAELGNAFACSVLCWKVREENKEEAFRLAQFAAAQHERDGFRWLGSFLCVGIGCEKDLNVGKENFSIAAELGSIYASNAYGHLVNDCDPARWLWLGRAALRGPPLSFLGSFHVQVEKFFAGSGNATDVFLIGRVLKGKIDVDDKRIFGHPVRFDFRITLANQAISFYDYQSKSARLAVDTWMLIATRMHVIKDMRIFIGKMIWEARFEANYKS